MDYAVIIDGATTKEFDDYEQAVDYAVDRAETGNHTVELWDTNLGIQIAF